MAGFPGISAMLVDAVHQARTARVTALRLGAIGGGAVVFAAGCAGLAGGRFGLVCFGGYLAAFLAGSAFRMLRAAARLEADRPAPASWSGATAATAIAATLAALGLSAFAGEVGAGQGLRLLAAYALAINAAYVPAKIACLDAGCCRQARPLAGALARQDLRHVEIAASLAALTLVALALAAGRADIAAPFGIAAHLGLRRVSHGLRQRQPRAFLSLRGLGLEQVALALASGSALALALVGGA